MPQTLHQSQLIVAPAADLARLLAERLLDQRRQQPGRALGLATGRTMEPVYAALAEAWRALSPGECAQRRRQWLSFNLDDYVGLGAADPRSFRAVMQRQLVQPLGLDPARVHLPAGDAGDPAAAVARYGAELAAAGGIGLQLLGIGLSGHVGFNEPPCQPSSPCRVVELDATTRHQNAADFGGDPARVPAQAITLGLAEILAAEEIVLMATGAHKAAVLRRALREPPTAALPASWLQGHPALTVLADAAAAAEL